MNLFHLACFGFVLLAIMGCGKSSVSATTRMLSDGSTLEDWKVDSMQGTHAQAGIVEEDGNRCLEVRYEMQRPDLNSKNMSTGVILDRVNADFQLQADEALAIRLLWEGGRNSFRIELQDDAGRGRMYEVPDLDRTDGWQEILVAPEQMETWGAKYVPGNPGRVRSLKLLILFSWTAGPGRVLIDSVRIVKKPESQEPVLGVSQLGYRPHDPKFVVARLEGSDVGAGFFRVVSLPHGSPVLEKPLQRVSIDGWPGAYFRGDFSPLHKSGRYQVEVSFDRKTWHRSEPFSIADRIFDDQTARLAFDFFGNLRSSDPRIFGYPELGGYRDTGTMLARYLNTNPHAIFGMARYIEAAGVPKSDTPRIGYALEEIDYGVRSMLDWQKPDGSVISSIVRDPDLYPHNQNPEENTRPWKTTSGDLFATLTYVPAMAAASRALAPYDPELSAKALNAALNTYRWADSRVQSKQTTALGHQLWGAVELHRATKKPIYLEQARALADRIVKRQFLDYSRVAGGVCGNLSNSGRSLNFDYQYKVIHELGMYLGLIELLPLLQQDDPLHGDVRFFLQTFARQYLLKMASLTPYQQIAEGLERNDDGSFRVALFHPPTGRLGAQSHGLNSDHLAYAYMGARLAGPLGLPELDDFATNQLQWIFGVNPLGISMMSGVGARQGRSLDEYLGLKPLPGGIMNGIVGHEGALPYWALHWVSGEYWIPQNAYYLAAMGEVERPSRQQTKSSPGLQIRLDLPSNVDGTKPLTVNLAVENPLSHPISSSLVFRSRGAYASEELVFVEPDGGGTIEVVRTLQPSGPCSPCLVSVVMDGRVVAEKFILPEFPAYQPPAALPSLKPVSARASSVQKNEPNVDAPNAIDGELATRWSSEFSDPQWLEVDLGEIQTVGKIDIHWETAYAESYELEASEDGKTWKSVHQVDEEDGGLDEINLSSPVRARWLKLTSSRRGTPYGNAIFEFKVFGSAPATSDGGAANKKHTQENSP